MWKSLLDMMFPICCLTCQKALDSTQQPLCLQCQFDLPITNHHEHPTNNPVAQKFLGRFPFQAAFCYLHFVQKGKTQQLLHQLKYKGNQDVGLFLGKLYGAILQNNGFTYDWIVPIPLHSSKLKQRGYNQVDCIAEGLAATLQTTWQPDILIRTRANKQQALQDKLGRLENANQLFEVVDENQIKGKNILLVDDMITSGATIESAALPLLAAGCQSLSIAALAAGS